MDEEHVGEATQASLFSLGFGVETCQAIPTINVQGGAPPSGSGLLHLDEGTELITVEEEPIAGPETPGKIQRHGC